MGGVIHFLHFFGISLILRCFSWWRGYPLFSLLPTFSTFCWGKGSDSSNGRSGNFQEYSSRIPAPRVEPMPNASNSLNQERIASGSGRWRLSYPLWTTLALIQLLPVVASIRFDNSTTFAK